MRLCVLLSVFTSRRHAIQQRLLGGSTVYCDTELPRSQQMSRFHLRSSFLYHGQVGGLRL